MRLRLATGTLSKTEDFMEMAQLALQAGLPPKAKRIVEQGYKAGALGTGAEAARHQRLRDLADKQEAERRRASPRQATEAGRREGRRRTGQGRLRLRLAGRGRQGHRADPEGHRQGPA
jgi:hypothetical protein